MTEEERAKLCEDLRQIYRYVDNDEINELIWQAAAEIEQQAKLVAALRNPEHDRFPLRTARDAAVEIERLEKLLKRGKH